MIFNSVYLHIPHVPLVPFVRVNCVFALTVDERHLTYLYLLCTWIHVKI